MDSQKQSERLLGGLGIRMGELVEGSPIGYICYRNLLLNRDCHSCNRCSVNVYWVINNPPEVSGLVSLLVLYLFTILQAIN